MITSTVLVSLFVKDAEHYLLFTERSKHLKHHPGEISFPGGRIEKHETSLEAVKRETKEEINADVLKVIDVLKPVMTYVSNHTILPYIGILEVNNLILNKDEVEEVHVISLERFMKTNMIAKRFVYQGEYITMPAWDFDNFFVWGATGRILAFFREWLSKENLQKITL